MKIYPPIKPSQDFLGDILGRILFLPILDPTIYANVSNTQVMIKSTNIGEESNLFSGEWSSVKPKNWIIINGTITYENAINFDWPFLSCHIS